jgi:hypothetical protein
VFTPPHTLDVVSPRVPACPSSTDSVLWAGIRGMHKMRADAARRMDDKRGISADRGRRVVPLVDVVDREVYRRPGRKDAQLSASGTTLYNLYR